MSDGTDEAGVTAWLNPDKLDSFEPNKRQLAFQKVATDATEEGFLLKREWLVRARGVEAFKKRPMRWNEYERWCAIPGFTKWFWEGFPPIGAPDDDELRLIDGQFWDGLIQGMKGQREWAYKLFSRIRHDNQNGKGTAQDDQEMQAFFGADNEAEGWHVAEA